MQSLPAGLRNCHHARNDLRGTGESRLCPGNGPASPVRATGRGHRRRRLIAPTPKERSLLGQRVAEVVAQGFPGPIKALLQALIKEIRVDGPDAIYPTVRLPWVETTTEPMQICAPSWSVEVTSQTRAAPRLKIARGCRSRALHGALP